MAINRGILSRNSNQNEELGPDMRQFGSLQLACNLGGLIAPYNSDLLISSKHPRFHSILACRTVNAVYWFSRNTTGVLISSYSSQ